MNYFVLLGIYILSSVVSQFLTSTPIELGSVAGVPIWLPLSAFTLVPLVDVMRSFTQNAAEKRGMDFKTTTLQMLGSSLSISLLCVVFAGLPVQIFAGVVAAITFGGIADMLVFKKMGQYFTHPVARMCFSNAAATLLGGGIVFAVAFTDLFFTNNPLAMPYFNAMVGWLTQSVVIWCASVGIGLGLTKFLNK